MFTIRLNNLIFFSYHGIYEEEKTVGNTYIVDVALTVGGNGKVISLDQTINYVTVFEVIKKRMSVATALLETLAQDIVHEIHLIDSRIKSINISIQKKYPPIFNFQGSVGINYKKEF